MLVDFRVTNFRSFRNEQDFSMQTGQRVRKYKENNTMQIKNERILKSALVFGANANGKTNLMNALMTLKRLVLAPTSNEVEPLLTDTFGHNTQNTIFKITFMKNDEKYDYILEYNSKEIDREELLVNDDLIFNRERQEFLHLPKQLEPVKKNIRKNQLLLFFAQQNNEHYSKNAFNWFLEDLVYANTNRIRNDMFQMLENDNFKSKFVLFLRAADFNIVDIEVRKRKIRTNSSDSMKEKKIDDDDDDDDTNFFIRYDVYSMHKSEQGAFSIEFADESTGTKVFMFLALYILSSKGKTLLIDEFDRSYHLELAKALLAVINNKGQTNQFILTSHELSLMDANLRQDQIWFAEKNQFGESELFSIFDFDNPELKRSDYNFKKRYLEGLYGATQMVNKKLLVEALKNE
ncbi:ATP/GTP-binding protein [Lactiplantibacillus plantarum]|uniref:AAA family ATPase n=1 Tax=Lactiplantibacillus plantarum TaxID=1590 RepID=UPI00351CA36B